jgi:hypothetical protein
MSAPGIVKVAAPATRPNAISAFVALRIIVSLSDETTREDRFWFIGKSFACGALFKNGLRSDARAALAE